jgi:hypothetical protein
MQKNIERGIAQCNICRLYFQQVNNELTQTNKSKDTTKGRTMNTATNNTATTAGLKVTSAIYTLKEGISVLIQLDPEATSVLWQYEVRFAGMKVIGNERSIDDIITQLGIQYDSYIKKINALVEAGYKFDNSQTDEDLASK